MNGEIENMAESKIWLGDRLPTIYDASIHLKYLSPSPRAAARSSVVYQYSVALKDIWDKSFTSSYVVSLSTILRTVSRVINEYDKFSHKHSKGAGAKSVRQINKEWREYCNRNYKDFLPQEKKGRPSKKRKVETPSTQSPSNNNSSALLDIGCSTDKLTGRERTFYLDQCGPRKMTLSEEVDEEFEEEKAKHDAEIAAQTQEDQSNESFSNPPELREVLTSPDGLSRNERHLSRTKNRATTFDQFTQTPGVLDNLDGVFIRPDIRAIRNVDPTVKDAIATASVRCAISIPKARVAYQAIMEKRFGHRYYISAEEQRKFEPLLSVIVEEEEPPQTKHVKSKDDYAAYKYVLPSNKVVASCKHEKALHQEIIAGNALGNLDTGTRVTLHFDSTSRSRIDGEWVALILNFLNDDESKCKMIPLRALFFGYEDREQIIQLVLETLRRLSVATGNKFSAKTLWENIYAFMTDAVSKNLKVEYAVAEALGSSHIPIHLLCKSHTCEVLDKSCLEALIEVECIIKFADLVTKRQPQLKSFVRQSRCVALAALKAMLSLVSHETSAKPTSLAEEFDLQLEKAGISKSMSLYKERRFTKLGYSAGSVFDCIDQYKKVLGDTACSNLLVQACNMYVENEYIIAAFKALGYFTFKVTMPFLNCVEQCDQNSLLPILKTLYEDLKEGRMNTLDRYSVPWTHVDTDKLKPSTPLDSELLKKMCKEAAKGVHLQCSREYWEEDDAVKARVTQLHKLSAEERECVP